jgi:hypothetical protein
MLKAPNTPVGGLRERTRDDTLNALLPHTQILADVSHGFR